jgi:hypothetical protein
MSDRLRELLLKAVRSLEPAEQDEVLGQLLIDSGARSMVFSPLHPLARQGSQPPDPDRTALAIEISTALGVASGDLKLLPIRLPTADYERLRAWSREHGFSMAVIIRTLVERFLASQQRGAARAVEDLDAQVAD